MRNSILIMLITVISLLRQRFSIFYGHIEQHEDFAHAACVYTSYIICFNFIGWKSPILLYLFLPLRFTEFLINLHDNINLKIVLLPNRPIKMKLLSKKQIFHTIYSQLNYLPFLLNKSLEIFLLLRSPSQQNVLWYRVRNTTSFCHA